MSDSETITMGNEGGVRGGHRWGRAIPVREIGRKVVCRVGQSDGAGRDGLSRKDSHGRCKHFFKIKKLGICQR